ncbi:MAG: hypothetical protein PVJ98_09275 [Akkermansiaceae bacterium]
MTRADLRNDRVYRVLPIIGGLYRARSLCPDLYRFGLLFALTLFAGFCLGISLLVALAFCASFPLTIVLGLLATLALLAALFFLSGFGLLFALTLVASFYLGISLLVSLAFCASFPLNFVFGILADFALFAGFCFGFGFLIALAFFARFTRGFGGCFVRAASGFCSAWVLAPASPKAAKQRVIISVFIVIFGWFMVEGALKGTPQGIHRR